MASAAAVTEDKKKYNALEPVLNFINKNFISTPDDELKRAKRILNEILDAVVGEMCKTDALFKKMYESIFYGGSAFDKLSVNKASDFDLDLLMKLPKYAEPTLTTSNIPGFVHLQMKNFDAFMKQPEAHLYKNFECLFDDKRYLDTKKVLPWMEGVLQKSLNSVGSGSPHRRVLTISEGRFTISFKKGGPALTLQITKDGQADFKMEIDLVPCFVFTGDKWPAHFRTNPVTSKSEFFIVPKAPKSGGNEKTERYWRLSFQEQERVLIDGKRTLKPTIKLLKKLRNTSDHKPIASYYIKTLVLWLNETKGSELWNNSLSYTFMTVLKEYQEFIANRKIPYYWYNKNNLLGQISGDNLINISNRLKIIINDVDKNLDDRTVIAKYLLTRQEFEEFKRKF